MGRCGRKSETGAVCQIIYQGFRGRLGGYAAAHVGSLRATVFTPDYLRPLELPVHIGNSTNTWGPLKPSQMWNIDMVQA